MKNLINACLVVCMYLIIICPSVANDLEAVTAIINEYMKNNGRGGAVNNQSLCGERIDIEYILNYEIIYSDKNRKILKLHTANCPEGNSVGEFIVSIVANRASFVGGDIIDPMKFVTDYFWISEDILSIRGRRWLVDDARCCPSQEIEIKYNMASGKQWLEVIGPANNGRDLDDNLVHEYTPRFRNDLKERDKDPERNSFIETCVNSGEARGIAGKAKKKESDICACAHDKLVKIGNVQQVDLIPGAIMFMRTGGKDIDINNPAFGGVKVALILMQAAGLSLLSCAYDM